MYQKACGRPKRLPACVISRAADTLFVWNAISFPRKPAFSYLPIGIVHSDPRSEMVLIELPHEAETGSHRLWVKQDQLDEPVEALA